MKPRMLIFCATLALAVLSSRTTIAQSSSPDANELDYGPSHVAPVFVENHGYYLRANDNSGVGVRSELPDGNNPTSTRAKAELINSSLDAFVHVGASDLNRPIQSPLAKPVATQLNSTARPIPQTEAVVVNEFEHDDLNLAELNLDRELSDLDTIRYEMDYSDSLCACSNGQSPGSSAANSHKGVFYANNFDYLFDNDDGDWWPGDSLKRRRLGQWATLDIGGQYRMRYHSEKNHRGAGLTGVDDDFLLHRLRLYANLEIGDRFRAYVEMIDAVSNYENIAPRGIEENRTDLLNIFGDIKLYDDGYGELWGRVGRQELLYGAQRTVSPLDWSNTRRRFEGYKVLWNGDDWDIDAFWVRPVPVVANRLDGPDQSQEFTGVYSSYKGLQNETLDMYYLRLAENNAATNFHFDTLGARYSGEHGLWLWEAEGAYQFGRFGGINHSAGAWTLGLGRKLPCIAWEPTIWAYYDWASGDATRGNGYHHLFPLSHKYLGFMDLFGRRNIEDFNVLLTAKPHKKVSLLLWYHLFNLQNGNDIPYSVGMGPSPGGVPGLVAGGSKFLGQELDTVVSWNINPRVNLLFGYSHFFAGSFFATNPTAGGLFSGDADFYYTQLVFNF